MTGSLQLIGSVLLVITAVLALASVLLHVYVKSWRSRVGRHLLGFMAALAAVLWLGVVRMVIGDQLGFLVLRVATFAVVPLMIAWRVRLQLQALRLPPLTPAPPAAADRPEDLDHGR